MEVCRTKKVSSHQRPALLPTSTTFDVVSRYSCFRVDCADSCITFHTVAYNPTSRRQLAPEILTFRQVVLHLVVSPADFRGHERLVVHRVVDLAHALQLRVHLSIEAFTLSASQAEPPRWRAQLLRQHATGHDLIGL